MRRIIALIALTALLGALALAGCSPKPTPTPQPQPVNGGTGAVNPEAPGTDPLSMVDVSNGIDKQEAQILGLAYLRASGKKESYQQTALSEGNGSWVVTYAVQYPEGMMGIPYSASIVIDAKTGRLINITEAQ